MFRITYYAALSVVLGVLVAHAQVWNWSKTSTSNGGIDPNINWIEGMAPTAVNNSARSTMQRIAQYRDDIAGMVVDVGSASAYSVSTNSGSNNPPKDKQRVCFVPANTNAPNATLSLDFGTAFPIQSPLGTGITTAQMIAGTPYCTVFVNASSAFVLEHVTGVVNAVPLGAMLDYAGSVAPSSNYVLPFGQAISRTTYSAYFTLVGTTYGTGDGATTFNVPDARGRLGAGIDNMGGSAANLITSGGSGIAGTTLGATGGAETHSVARSDLPNVTIPIPGGQGSHSHTISPTTAQTGGFYDPAANSSGAVSGANATQSATLPAMNTASINGNVTQGGVGISPVMVLTKILRVL